MLRNILRGAGLTKQVTRNQGFSMSAPVLQKVYELRTYNLVPDKVGEFLALSKEKFHLRTKHSVLLGYWTAELGGLNQVVHLWEYGSLKERAGVRAKLGGDPEWQAEYFQRILPMFQNQENYTLTSLSDIEAAKESGGVYELWELDMSGQPDSWRNILETAIKGLLNENRTICGVFTSQFGPMNRAVVIWNHNDIDAATSTKADLLNSQSGKDLWKSVVSGHSKLMAPTSFSPWK